ncbi:MAG TPA: aspartate-semialdehyde dehydrogenase [Gemmatimonadales bacterium]|jgi:aspartate-semialdehyde dehydrogenase|nr:aspartate-semialdehyde dehydrogenase [Gemmatimonadales bacterium]
MSKKIPIAILGATGTVGQKFVRLLSAHPWFEVTAVAASSASAGKSYEEATRWRESVPVPSAIGGMMVRECAPPLPARIVFSALDADVAGPIEQAFAQAGAVVVTNARNHRLDPDVPLLIPEINPDHLGLIDCQRESRGWNGAIVANPNCSTAALALALAPLHRAFGIERLFVSTMQAVSGAGYPGVASLDIVGNVIPYVSGEEEKIERESRKILGRMVSGAVEPADFLVSAHTNRVAVVDGHMAAVSVGLRRKAGPDEALQTLRDFRGSDRVCRLPSSPNPPIEVDSRVDRPQPRLDLDRGGGMAVTVGRIRACSVLDLRMVVLGHNTVRGAAGQGVQIAELLVADEMQA